MKTKKYITLFMCACLHLVSASMVSAKTMKDTNNHVINSIQNAQLVSSFFTLKK